MNLPLTGCGDHHVAAAHELQAEFLRFKRSLHLIRTATDLHHSATPAGVPIMGLLRRLGPTRTTGLAAELCLDPSTVSRQVDGLTRSGLVEKVADPGDRRATLIRLTDAGSAALQSHIDKLTDTVGDLLDGWSTDDLRTLTALMARLNDDVSARLAPQQHEES